MIRGCDDILVITSGSTKWTLLKNYKIYECSKLSGDEFNAGMSGWKDDLQVTSPKQMYMQKPKFFRYL